MQMTQSVAVASPRIHREDRMRARLDALLDGWAAWCRSYRMRLDYAPGVLQGGAVTSKSFDDMCDELDHSTNERIDAAVDDLPPACRAALYRHRGLSAVFRFPRENYAEKLDQAHDRLLHVLPRKGVMLDF